MTRFESGTLVASERVPTSARPCPRARPTDSPPFRTAYCDRLDTTWATAVYGRELPGQGVRPHLPPHVSDTIRSGSSSSTVFHSLAGRTPPDVLHAAGRTAAHASISRHFANAPTWQISARRRGNTSVMHTSSPSTVTYPRARSVPQLVRGATPAAAGLAGSRPSNESRDRRVPGHKPRVVACSPRLVTRSAEHATDVPLYKARFSFR